MRVNPLALPAAIAALYLPVPASAGPQGETASAPGPDVTIVTDAGNPLESERLLGSMSQTIGARIHTLTAIDAPIPVPPDGVEGSGVCQITFGLTARGTTRDVDVDCPSSRYARVLRRAAQGWTYEPLVVAGRVREPDTVRMTVRYRLDTVAN